jgi:hypothetical protein
MFSVEVTKEYDVIVIGGGTAGVFAADGAARMGARTLLIEKNGMLGGTMTSGGVNFPGVFHYWGRQIITGPAWDFIEKLNASGAAVMPKNERAPKHFYNQQIRVNAFLAATEMERLCRDSGVEILMHSMPSYAVETDGGVDLVITCKEGMFAAHAKKIIDCTGDANVAAMLGYERVRASVLQPVTHKNTLDGYKIEDIDENEVIAAFDKAFSEKFLDPVLFSWKSPYKMLKQKKIDLHIPCHGAESSEEKTKMELDSHESLARTLEVFRAVKGCEKIRVASFAAECGIRETCRIVGEETMDAERYLSGYVYDDAVCYAVYPIDRHTLSGIDNTHFEENVFATLPYRAMIPKGSKHVLVAGGAVSSDEATNSAIRVQAPCMAMGTAAGIAAALAAGSEIGVLDVDIADIKNELKALKATVPERINN